MTSSFAKLDQALGDLIEAYSELGETLEEKYGEDEEAFSTAVVEALESCLETAMEENDVSSGFVATLLASFTEALEEVDPSAFDDEDDEGDNEVSYDVGEVGYDDGDEDPDD